jgi:hypothetical protein
MEFIAIAGQDQSIAGVGFPGENEQAHAWVVECVGAGDESKGDLRNDT